MYKKGAWRNSDEVSYSFLATSLFAFKDSYRSLQFSALAISTHLKYQLLRIMVRMENQNRNLALGANTLIKISNLQIQKCQQKVVGTFQINQEMFH